jgi:hypothetical protein
MYPDVKTPIIELFTIFIKKSNFTGDSTKSFASKLKHK